MESENKRSRQLVQALFRESLFQSELPPHLYIEPTNACHLACVMCPRDQSRKPVGFLDFTLFEKIVSDSLAYGTRRRIILHKDGEPLLHPELERMISYLKEKRAARTVAFSTSGFGLNEEKARALIESGLDEINFAVDGATKETYEKIRRNSRFEEVEENIRSFVRLRNSHSHHPLEVIVRIIEMPAVSHEMEAFQKKWETLVDQVEVRPFRSWAGRYQPQFMNVHEERVPCLYLWTSLAINWDGSVSICSLDYDSRAIVGNVKDESLYDIWHGEAHRKIRLAHLEGRYSELPACASCLDWPARPDFWNEGTRRMATAELLD